MIISLVLSIGEVSLNPVVVDDAEFILSLRADPELNRYISSTPQDAEEQRKWLRDYKQREAEGLEYYFIISKNEVKLGTIRAYDFRCNSFCWGSWIILRGVAPQVAVASVLMIYDFAFNHLGFAKSHFDVRKDNKSVRSFHLRMGARIVHSDDLDDYFEYSETSYLEHRPKLLRQAGGKGQTIFRDNLK